MKYVKVIVYHDQDNLNKVSAIKVWRTITGAGLKDSKDFVDAIYSRGYVGRVAVVLNMAQAGEMMLVDQADLDNSGLVFAEVVRYERDTIIDFSSIPQ